MIETDKIGYARVSTNEQDPENQARVLSAAGIPSDFIFIDRGISGTIPADKRPGFVRARDYIAAHPRDVKYLYVVEISRLGRTTMETLNLIHDLETSGTMVWSLSDKESFMRTEEKSNRQLLLMIMTWMAERERDNLIRRTKEGLDRARAEGKILGQPKAVIDFEQVNKARVEGASWEDIAGELGITVMTLYRARRRRG
jgi:putative DNA-invertase from lambdoid prophage Rac